MPNTKALAKAENKIQKKAAKFAAFFYAAVTACSLNIF